jgi:hypothetical protein
VFVRKICCAQIVYYDGQFNDARLNVALAQTAALAGATVLNYTGVTRLIKVSPLSWLSRPRLVCDRNHALLCPCVSKCFQCKCTGCSAHHGKNALVLAVLEHACHVKAVQLHSCRRVSQFDLKVR